MPSTDQVITQTKNWVEKAVIGLNLCPFAKAVHLQKRIRYVVSEARSIEDLVRDLQRELRMIHNSAAEDIDTTLLIHPYVLEDFLDFNDFLEIADEAIAAENLSDDIQIASFHPRYQFAGTEPEDIENYTNRAPFPILQLLREASLDVAIDGYLEQNGDLDQIFEKNIRTLKKIGLDGWKKLDLT